MLRPARSHYYPQTQSTRLMELAVSGEGETCAQPINSAVELQDIYDKLYNYEQAQAEGLIIKLPVPIGTKVYYFSKSCDGRELKGLLHGTDLSTPCPHYNKQRGICMKKEVSASVWNSSENARDTCETDLEIIDINCLYRLYSGSLFFQFGMTDRVVTKFTLPMSLDALYLSEADMKSGLTFTEQQMIESRYDNPSEMLRRKAKYF